MSHFANESFDFNVISVCVHFKFSLSSVPESKTESFFFFPFFYDKINKSKYFFLNSKKCIIKENKA